MRREDAIRIRHMIEAAQAALDFVRGRERADLDHDRMLLFALVRAVELVGEAASRISPDARARAPDIPWPAIVAMRNRLVHVYFDIDRDILWKTVKVELPDLVRKLERILEAEEGDGSQQP